MNTTIKDKYIQMINQKEISIELLIACVANLEPKISKCAYNKKKYQNSWFNQSGYMGNDNDEKFKELMSYRNNIMNVLKDKFTLDEVRQKAKLVDKTGIVTDDIIKSVISMINSKNYLLCS